MLVAYLRNGAPRKNGQRRATDTYVARTQKSTPATVDIHVERTHPGACGKIDVHACMHVC